MRTPIRQAGLSAAVVAMLLAVAACGTTTDTGSATSGATKVAEAQAAGIQSAADPTKLVDCSDGQSQVASFEPRSTDLASYFSDSTISKIRQRGRLIVGTSGDVLQWGYRNPVDASLKGFDIELVTKIAASLGVGVQYTVINYGDRLPYLEQRKVDIVAHTMTINCTRWKDISFSTEYYDAGQSVLVRYDPKTEKPLLKGVEELGGKTVCVGAGSTNVGNIEEKATQLKIKINIVQEADLGNCLVRFQLGEVDAITGDDTVLAGFAKQDPYAAVVGDKFSTEPYGLGFNKDDRAFTEYVNVLLDEWRNDDAHTLAGLGKRYMGAKATPVPPAVYGRTSNPGPVS